jgi:chaperonin cofactor prefoldin
MSETAMLDELQITRRELENELASLSSKESVLKGGLRKLEEKIIAQLEKAIYAKRLTISGLESQKSDLEKKLRELQGNQVVMQKPDQPCAKVETAKAVQQGPAEEAVIVNVVEGHLE